MENEIPFSQNGRGSFPRHRYYVLAVPISGIKAVCERIEQEGQEVFQVAFAMQPAGGGGAVPLTLIIGRAGYTTPLSRVEIEANEKASSKLVLPG